MTVPAGIGNPVLAAALARMRGGAGAPAHGANVTAPPVGGTLGARPALPPGMEVPARPPANMQAGGGFGTPPGPNIQPQPPGGTALGAGKPSVLQGALARFRQPGPMVAPGVRPGTNPGASY